MLKFKPLFTDDFSKIYSRLDKQEKERVDKAIDKLLIKPELGKPLRYELAGLRSEHVGKFRLLFEIKEDTVIFHTFEHRKKVYRWTQHTHHITQHEPQILIHEPYILFSEDFSSRLFHNGLVSAAALEKERKGFIEFIPFNGIRIIDGSKTRSK